MTKRETELGDPLVGDVGEDEPDLPAVDEDALDGEDEVLTVETPDPAGYDPQTQPEPL